MLGFEEGRAVMFCWSVSGLVLESDSLTKSQHFPIWIFSYKSWRRKALMNSEINDDYNHKF